MLRKICCIGADNVGGPFSSVLAFKCPDIKVYVFDSNEERIMKWNSLEFPLNGNEFADIIKKSRDENLFFTSEPSEAIRGSDIIFISVNSEMKNYGHGKGKTVDLKPLEDAAHLIAKFGNPSQIIVEKTTIPTRAAETVRSILKDNYQVVEENTNQEKDFVILSNPSFISNDTLLNELLFPERVLIGGDKTPESKEAMNTLTSLFENWVPSSKILTSDTWSTELAKLAVNAFLAQRISSINSLSEICEATNADVSEVILAIGMNPRLGRKEEPPLIGFGGPTLHKNILNLVYLCESLNLPQVATYWQKVLDFNEHQKKRFTKKIIQAFFNTLTGKSIAILGFSFKKNSKETTESPAVYVCKTLLEEGALLKIYDPVVPTIQIKNELKESCGLSFEELSKSVTFTDDPYDAAEETHGIVICTDWEQFSSLDFYKVYNVMMKPAYVFDGWKILPHDELKEIGFKVQTIGKNLEPNFTPAPEEGN